MCVCTFSSIGIGGLTVVLAGGVPDYVTFTSALKKLTALKLSELKCVRVLVFVLEQPVPITGAFLPH